MQSARDQVLNTPELVYLIGELCEKETLNSFLLTSKAFYHNLKLLILKAPVCLGPYTPRSDLVRRTFLRTRLARCESLFVLDQCGWEYLEGLLFTQNPPVHLSSLKQLELNPLVVTFLSSRIDKPKPTDPDPILATINKLVQTAPQLDRICLFLTLNKLPTTETRRWSRIEPYIRQLAQAYPSCSIAIHDAVSLPAPPGVLIDYRDGNNPPTCDYCDLHGCNLFKQRVYTTTYPYHRSSLHGQPSTYVMPYYVLSSYNGSYN